MLLTRLQLQILVDLRPHFRPDFQNPPRIRVGSFLLVGIVILSTIGSRLDERVRNDLFDHHPFGFLGAAADVEVELHRILQIRVRGVFVVLQFERSEPRFDFVERRRRIRVGDF
ncbi:hypothetical protein ABFS83_07G051300 [Erythranthe nasuta]